MERILIKRTTTNTDNKESLSFYVIQLKDYHTCFLKFFADEENLKYNSNVIIEIVDKKVIELYEKLKNVNIYKK